MGLDLDKAAPSAKADEDGAPCYTCPSIREYEDGLPVEIWRLNGRLVIRAYNECGCRFTDVDLIDLVNWLSSDHGKRLVEAATSNNPDRATPRRD